MSIPVNRTILDQHPEAAWVPMVEDLSAAALVGCGVLCMAFLVIVVLGLFFIGHMLLVAMGV